MSARRAERARARAGARREVEQELPGLRAARAARSRWARAAPLTGDSPPDVEARLRELSSRFRGARAVGIRREPVPAAYRVFFRHIGLDPDVDAHADRGGGARADAARRLPHRRAARGRAADRAARHRRAGVGARRRRARRAARDPPEPRGRAARTLGRGARCCPPGGSSSPTPRRRWRVLFGELAAGHAPRAAHARG